MTRKEFDEKYPLIFDWIKGTLSVHASKAKSVASLGFKRLPLYFNQEILTKAKVVYLPAVPLPPLNAMGLGQFADFENMDSSGITFVDMILSRYEMREDEGHHFHELVHIVQWQFLGTKRFVEAYAEGIERSGYRAAPLEVMAYTLASVFRNAQAPFDVAAIVREQLSALYF